MKKFRQSGGKVLFQRSGSMGGRLTKKSIFRPPPGVRKGIWVFPWPFFDYFFVSSSFNDLLPKRIRDDINHIDSLSDEDVKKLWDDHDIWWKKNIKQLAKLRQIWWSGVTYSRIGGKGSTEWSDEWYRFERASDYLRAAKKHTVWFSEDGKFSMWNSGPHQNWWGCLSVDSLECFIPSK